MTRARRGAPAGTAGAPRESSSTTTRNDEFRLALAIVKAADERMVRNLWAISMASVGVLKGHREILLELLRCGDLQPGIVISKARFLWSPGNAGPWRGGRR